MILPNWIKWSKVKGKYVILKKKKIEKTEINKT